MLISSLIVCQGQVAYEILKSVISLNCENNMYVVETVLKGTGVETNFVEQFQENLGA